jgi:hypothetical protein
VSVPRFGWMALAARMPQLYRKRFGVGKGA